MLFVSIYWYIILVETFQIKGNEIQCAADWLYYYLHECTRIASRVNVDTDY